MGVGVAELNDEQLKPIAGGALNKYQVAFIESTVRSYKASGKSYEDIAAWAEDYFGDPAGLGEVFACIDRCWQAG